jgi:hypothetical protein
MSKAQVVYRIRAKWGLGWRTLVDAHMRELEWTGPPGKAQAIKHAKELMRHVQTLTALRVMRYDQEQDDASVVWQWTKQGGVSA